MNKLRVLDLFSGIGGFSLGLERTGGFETVAFCEIEPFPRRVLAKHWPEIHIHDDVRTLTKETLCKGYAENALLIQLCKETGGNLASARTAIENIRTHAEKRTRQDITNAPQSAEEALLTIMAGSALAAEFPNTDFWQSTTSIIMEMLNASNTKVLFGNSLLSEDFLTTIRFFATTATWQKPFTVPVHIKAQLGLIDYDARLAADGIAVDVICGGFPCQDISEAGKRKGLDDERSGLWSEIARLIDALSPRYVVIENSNELRSNGFATIAGNLASLGYDIIWHCIPASDIGARHIRDRMWIVGFLPDSKGGWLQQCWRQQFAQARDQRRRLHYRFNEPEPPRVADGVPGRMDRLRALGNAVVPQIPELIGHAILAAERERLFHVQLKEAAE